MKSHCKFQVLLVKSQPLRHTSL